MNPSASGWIEKFGHLAAKEAAAYPDFTHLYDQLRRLGFAYGMNVCIPDFIRPTHELTQDERAKINLLFGLFATHRLQRPGAGFDAFLESVFSYYKALGVGRITFLQKILSGRKTSSQLEKLLDSRIYLGGNVLSKTFNSMITNSLLQIDVLTYKHYLEQDTDPRTFARNLEFVAVNIANQALSAKRKKPSDERLRDLFQASLTYMEHPPHPLDLSYRGMLEGYRGTAMAAYLMDVACLTVWEDNSLEYLESEFVLTLGRELGLDGRAIREALNAVTEFFAHYADQLSVFNKENYYDNMSKVVGKLIRRNSRRLQSELSQSRELVYLLSKSTVKELSGEERKKMQEQLLDLFKSIPSLAIFLLPGGALLLPIFISLIPKLLPSSFDENRVDPEENTGYKENL
ncbi:LETM1-related biofilm-associated protein [Robiginitalea sp. M366]|uniref:LETM1-related biofilm-associated protein n=1 Tax=Robiginitalea aestuariiviva TaxID=3036903 RepID=UPI00240D84C0|nr:LETM1-related biofilm-associated protein [Robiginitalea aestuariiviva]MDG1573415.1 LETM1-related biofilm-associated protein [Robiginitalea aestuariiviva]